MPGGQFSLYIGLNRSVFNEEVGDFAKKWRRDMENMSERV